METSDWRQHLVSLVLSCAAASAVWLAFYPTVFSRDAFYMLLDAVRGRYSDMHSLLIPMAVSIVIGLGGNVSFVTLSQIVLGFLGIRRLVLALSRLIGREDARLSEIVVLVTLAFLASPLTRSRSTWPHSGLTHGFRSFCCGGWR